MKPENWWASTSGHQAGAGSSRWHERGGNSQVLLAGHSVDFTATLQGEQVTDSWKSGFLCPLNFYIWLVGNIWDSVLYAFKAWSIPELSQEGTHGVALDHQRALSIPAACSGGFSQLLLSEPSQMGISRNTCKARLASDVPKSWVPLSVKPWSRSARVKTSQRRNEFLLSAASPLVFHRWEKKLRWRWLNVGARVALSQWEVQAPFHHIRNGHLKLATSPHPSVASMFVYVK